jgi:hypothetical protein
MIHRKVRKERRDDYGPKQGDESLIYGCGYQAVALSGLLLPFGEMHVL